MRVSKGAMKSELQRRPMVKVETFANPLKLRRQTDLAANAITRDE